MLFAAVAPIFIIIAAGFFLRWRGALTTGADASLLKISINLQYPCLIVATIVGNDALKQSLNVWLPPLAGFTTVMIGYAVCYLGARLLKLEKERDIRTFTFVTGLYNYGYTAIPIVEKLFGSKTMGVLFTHNLGVEIAFWIGASLILSSRAEANSERKEIAVWRRILSMPVIAIIVSLILNFLHASEWAPVWLFSTARMIGASAIPMALLLTGATLYDSLYGAKTLSRAEAFTLAGACFLRLGALPFTFLALARWLPCSVELKQVLVVQAAMPCAMLPIVLAKHYGGNPSMAVQIVFATTLLGIFTIPLWVRFGMQIAGLPS